MTDAARTQPSSKADPVRRFSRPPAAVRAGKGTFAATLSSILHLTRDNAPTRQLNQRGWSERRKRRPQQRRTPYSPSRLCAACRVTCPATPCSSRSQPGAPHPTPPSLLGRRKPRRSHTRSSRSSAAYEHSATFSSATPQPPPQRLSAKPQPVLFRSGTGESTAAPYTERHAMVCGCCRSLCSALAFAALQEGIYR
jgi:hypothetical protein